MQSFYDGGKMQDSYIPAGNRFVNERSVRSPTKRIRMGKASRFNKPALFLHQVQSTPTLDFIEKAITCMSGWEIVE